ncbi:hypothetical protein BH18ACT15_BH18ACT15_09610 [soil metagenome]
MSRAHSQQALDHGDRVVVLIANTLASLRDIMAADGFTHAADLIADLAEIADDYVARTCG